MRIRYHWRRQQGASLHSADERQSEQPLLTIRHGQTAQVNERCRQNHPVLDDSYCARLLDDEEPLAAVLRLRDLDGEEKLE